jgi:steroid delta-isomerase-like uncharacterized protein
MSAQANSALARVVYDAFNNNDIQAILTLADNDIEFVLIPFDQHFYGLEGFGEFMQSFKAAFPDCTINLMNQVVSDEKVVNEFMVSGTHAGVLASPRGEIPATGRSIGYYVCEVWEVKNGKLAKVRTYFDTTTILRQLGVTPAPGE